MVSCPPGGPCLTSRVYPDGALYYLAEEPGAAAHWNPIAQLSSEGTHALEALYAELCGRTDPVMANDSGSVLHRVTSPGCTREFVVTGIPSGDLARIGEATDIINRSVQPARPPEPALETVCGGMIPGPGCAETEYCHFELDAICGAADQTGVCRPRPAECPGGEPPVCGCNDQTFPSACEAHRFGVSVAGLGACGAPL